MPIMFVCQHDNKDTAYLLKTFAMQCSKFKKKTKQKKNINKTKTK